MTTPQTNKELVEAAKGIEELEAAFEKLLAVSEHGMISCDGCRKLLNEVVDTFRTALQSNPDNIQEAGK